MLMYALIGLSLVLVGVAGLQFAYLFYIDRIFRERQKYLQDLEHRYRAAKQRIAEQDELLAAAYLDLEKEDWAEVIEER